MKKLIVTEAQFFGVVTDEQGNEKLVIIDSCLSDDVWNDYYKKNARYGFGI